MFSISEKLGEGKAVAQPPRWSRQHSLLCVSALAIFLIVMDSSVSAKWASHAQSELMFYAFGFFAALAYSRFARICPPLVKVVRSSAAAAGQCEEVHLSGTHGPVPQAPSLFKAIRARASKVASQLRASISGLAQHIKPPRRNYRPGQEKPVVPLWGVYATGFVLTVMCVTLIVVAFMATTPGTVPGPTKGSFIDPLPKACAGSQSKAQYAWRASIWLVIVVWLSSVLCAIHPLQSGLILGF